MHTAAFGPPRSLKITQQSPRIYKAKAETPCSNNRPRRREANRSRNRRCSPSAGRHRWHAERGIRNVGVPTEMLTEDIAELYKAGHISGTRKTLNPSKIVYSFALGSSRRYAMAHHNPDFLCCPVDYTNPPQNIPRNDRDRHQQYNPNRSVGLHPMATAPSAAPGATPVCSRRL